MEDNVIKVSVIPNKQNSVKVSSNVVSTPITANSDTSQLWSQVSKNWAVSEIIVDNTDYSSKYYANKAKENAENAQGISDSVKADYNEFLIASLNANEQLQTGKEEALTSLEGARAEAENSINNTKTTAINDIEFVADGEKQEIQELADNAKDDIKSTGFYMRDDKLYFINSEGEEQEFKSGGGGGLDIGDIGFTQMAIDETLGKRRILNGQVIIQEQYVEFTNIIKNSVALNPDLACTEAEWQTTVTMSANGVCYKFVIDDEGGTIRLPKYPQYLDLSINTGAVSQTVSVYGNGKTLSFNAGGDDFSFGRSGSNTVYYDVTNVGVPVGSSIKTTGLYDNLLVGVTTDASKSGLTGSVIIPSVQSEKIKGQYFIQVATGAETEDNIINEIELNNPHSFGDSKYSPVALNNLSWLKSEGQWNPKAVYPSYYDWALTSFNNGVEGFALSTGEYTDYDVVINSAEETFRLPLLDGSEDLPSNRYNNLTLGASNDTYTAPANGWFFLNLNMSSGGNAYMQNMSSSLMAGKDQGGTSCFSSIFAKRGDIVKVIYNGTVQNIYAFSFVTAKGNGSLYFYVGETVQNANLINAGRIEEKLVDKLDNNALNLTEEGKSLLSGFSMPSNRSINLTIGASGSLYVAPANGWFILNCQTQDTATTSNRYVALDNYTTGMTDMKWFTNATNLEYSGFVPAKKGETVALVYSGSLALNSWGTGFKFIYAEGDQ